MDVDFKKLADEERKRKERDMWGDVEKEKCAPGTSVSSLRRPACVLTAPAPPRPQAQGSKSEQHYGQQCRSGQRVRATHASDDGTRPRAPRTPSPLISPLVPAVLRAHSDFHMYRNARRVELERLDQMEKQAKADEAASEFERTRIERAQREAERTAKRAAKRAKKKSKKKTPKGSDGAHGAAAGDDNGSESDDSGQRGEHKAGSAAKHGSR